MEEGRRITKVGISIFLLLCTQVQEAVVPLRAPRTRRCVKLIWTRNSASSQSCYPQRLFLGALSSALWHARVIVACGPGRCSPRVLAGRDMAQTMLGPQKMTIRQNTEIEQRGNSRDTPRSPRGPRGPRGPGKLRVDVAVTMLLHVWRSSIPKEAQFGRQRGMAACADGTAHRGKLQ